MKNDQKEDIFHSSGYAKAQSGDSFGAASSITFDARKRLNDNREHIQGYDKSQIINESHPVARAKTYTPPVKTPGPTPPTPPAR